LSRRWFKVQRAFGTSSTISLVVEQASAMLSGFLHNRLRTPGALDTELVAGMTCLSNIRNAIHCNRQQFTASYELEKWQSTAEPSCRAACFTAMQSSNSSTTPAIRLEA
jgi:hypothetical protein